MNLMPLPYFSSKFQHAFMPSIGYLFSTPENQLFSWYFLSLLYQLKHGTFITSNRAEAIQEWYGETHEVVFLKGTTRRTLIF
mmetsp:Transcript_18548/g.27502  ORF Transcript_18548/g.27502 Transcript_18548/m.27502 type:complete len:82 (-) Transcript_18548:1369-1614(-)